MTSGVAVFDATPLMDEVIANGLDTNAQLQREILKLAGETRASKPVNNREPLEAIELPRRLNIARRFHATDDD